MKVISNSSPLIILSSVQEIKILKHIYGKVYIPDSVYQETVVENEIELQKKDILKGIEEKFLEVVTPQADHSFARKIDEGEKGVLNLALDMKANLILIDDERAIKEAEEFGLKVFKISNILLQAEELGLIDSYLGMQKELEKKGFYLKTP